MMNRRDFLKGAAAAAVVSQVGLGEEVIAAPTPELAPNAVNAGIENMGNGWYRCWMSFEDKITSTYAKAAGKPNLHLCGPKSWASFDLERGLVTGCDETEDKIQGRNKIDGIIMDEFSYEAEDAYLWGTQIEETNELHNLRLRMYDMRGTVSQSQGSPIGTGDSALQVRGALKTEASRTNHYVPVRGQSCYQVT